MAKKRVYEVAKQLNISNKDLIDKLKGIGVEVSNHMASIDDATIEKVTELLAPKKEEKKAEEKPAAPAEAKKAEQPKNNNNNNGNNNNSNRNQKNNQNNNRNQFVKNDQPKKNGQNGQNGNNQQNRNDNRNDNRSNGSNQRNDGQQKNNGSNANVNNGNNKNKNKNNNNNNNNNGFNNNRNNNNKNNKNNNNNNNNNKNNGKNKNNKQNQAPKPEPVAAPEEDEIRTMEIPETLTVKELAEKIGKSGAEIVKCLMKKGIMAAINQTVDFDTAVSVGEEYNVIFEPEVEKDIFEEAFKQEEEDESVLEPRPPVVVVMGHVDHGKTSLLDAIRHSHVTSREAGGITQHIGAYTVEINGSPITFLDTPGHEAFTAMRLRGAMITDIAVLVVAADDGVMPQTIEAINHAKAAGVEVIVAINKIDKPSANPDRVKQELVEYGLVAEDWGGETICVPVSAQTKEGIDTLLEMIILTAEMKELKANPNKPARGAIIEAQLDKGRGPVATVLVQEGTLNVGDPIVAGAAYGKIRAMMDDKGRRVKKAGPSKPVEILGLSEVPAAGETFYVAANEKQARQLAESVIAKSRKDMLKDTPQKVSLDDLFNQIQSGNVKELNIVVKADVQGSVEAVKQSLEKLSNDEVRIRIIHGGVGAITESDVMLATASNAIIIGFNVRPEPSAKAFADEEKVDVRLYRVIYNAIEDITAAMKGMLDPVYEEKVIGHAEVRQLFKASGVGVIAGSYVLDGKFQRNAQARILRDNVVVYEGEIESLKRFKDDVKEVNTGYECGLVFKKFNDIKEGDIVEAFIMVEVPR
ncbi:translation initiation factor IF-2 [Anaerotignum sp. MSJ-24]|uniref:translation initiation factor IF-2 n=1 Tax=Anaerotignum sp. MSJ-24 TaxID=2841521 RepID=UPI001C10A171|nr:translation initiation factor IF-2 [Anaerotignum sp. MSJ-24]MBU5463807.1 translation initiation factor IF-2 [Anaerotignum sp. MSJ-24]